MGQPITQTIQELHEKLDQRLHQPHVTPREICDLADALARCYAVLGDVTSAQRFFAQAAEAAFAWIEHPNYPKVHGRPDGNSRHILRCARLLWRANDTRASQYFHQAISIAETGIDVQSYRLRCWLHIMYSHMFLDEFSDAAAALQAATTIRQQSVGSFNPPEFFDVMLTAVLAGQEATTNSYRRAIQQMEAMFASAKIEIYWGNPAPDVDLLELLKRKLAALTDHATELFDDSW
jgi:hypothetical protein